MNPPASDHPENRLAATNEAAAGTPPASGPAQPDSPSSAPSIPAALTEPAELAEWKDDLRSDFESWLAAIDAIPAEDRAAEDDDHDTPDLYSFYAQLAAASAESRKANRRTAEAMSQWGETLARFENGLQPLRETTAQLAAAQPNPGRMARAQCLILVELLDRMHRLARAFAAPPVAKRSWWGAGGDAAWRQAWDAQQQALAILVGHVEGLLAKEGVARIVAAGQPFDPAVMMAVAVESDATHPPQTVLDELAAGYTREGELLRAAQVKVSRQP